nr:hypothetical protein [Haloarchaeobius amylolyticus]
MVALVAGILGFALVTVAVTAGFESEIAFSLLIGLPMGVYAGTTAVFVAYVGLWYRDRVATGEPGRTAARLRWSAVASVAAFVLSTALGLALYLVFDASIGIGMLVLGVPAVVLVAAIVGYVVGGGDSGVAPGQRSSSG